MAAPDAPIQKVVTHQYVNPLVAIALGALVLGDQLTVAVGAGAALIVVSVFVAVRSERRPRARTQEPGAAALPVPAPRRVTRVTGVRDDSDTGACAYV